MITAFILGLLGSWHCAAMCGNLVGALCRQTGMNSYLLGRWVSYTLSGALLGSLGSWALPWMGWRVALGTAGMAMLFLAYAQGRAIAAPLPVSGRPNNSTTGLVAQIWLQLGPLLRTPRPTNSTRFLLGVTTVLFPCGLLSAAWLKASTSGSALLGAATMACFAAGSIPGLLAPRLFLRLLPTPWQPQVQRLAVTVSGLWMLYLALKWDVPAGANANGYHCL